MPCVLRQVSGIPGSPPTHNIAEDGLELATLLSLPHKCWNCRYAPILCHAGDGVQDSRHGTKAFYPLSYIPRPTNTVVFNRAGIFFKSYQDPQESVSPSDTTIHCKDKKIETVILGYLL